MLPPDIGGLGFGRGRVGIFSLTSDLSTSIYSSSTPRIRTSHGELRNMRRDYAVYQKVALSFDSVVWTFINSHFHKYFQTDRFDASNVLKS